MRERSVLLPMGLAAIAHVFLSLLRPGDHVLLGETVYGPARAIALNFLGPRGIACEFYPGGREEVAKRLRPSTRLVYLDNPGSIVYDIQDVPALAWLLKGRDTLLAVDNTWGCPRPLSPAGARGGSFGGCDHQVCRRSFRSRHGGGGGGPRCADQLWRDATLLGQTVSPDEAYNALKGLRSAAARLAMHTAHAAEVVAWLKQQPQVKRILYPPLPEDPGHALWRRDFKGANGLLSIEFAPPIAPAAADRFVDSLRLFGIVASWGLRKPGAPYPVIPGWHGGALVRLHIGLEDPADLIANLAQGFRAALA